MAELVSEHAAITAPKPDAEQPRAEKATAKMVNDLLTRSSLASRDLRAKWPEYYKFVVSGEQWPQRRPRWRFSEVVNICWANIMTETAIQSDSRPVVDYSAQEPSDFEFAEMLKEINSVNWEKPLVTGHGWQRKIQTAIFKSKIYHVVHAMVGWDPEMGNGLGDISFEILDPYGCFWDPIAENIGEARYFIYAKPVPTSFLRKKYPKYAEQIKPDVSLIVEPSQDGIDDHDVDRFHMSTWMGTTEAGRRSDRDSNKYGGEPMTLWVRAWLKDDTVEELQHEIEKGDGSTEIEFVKKMKYPKGRYIEVANSTVIEDRENEFEDGLFPICTLVNYDYGEYAGDPEVTHQQGPQHIINYTWSHILDQMKMGANPRTVVTHNAQDIVKKITNEPGLVIEVPNQADVRFEPGTGIAPGMFNILESSLSLIDKVSGLQDVSRGAPQPGVTSGLMLEGFVEASQTRPRMKNRTLEEFLTQVGYLMASRYLQFYTAPRVFRITNKDGWPEFVEFFISADEEGNKIANISSQIKTPEGMIQGQNAQIAVKGIPDVKVQTGSSLPFARAQKTATALDLQSRGMITGESLLKSINWPDAEEEAKAAQDEQAQLAAGAAGAGT